MQGASHQMWREQSAVILSKTTVFTSALLSIHEALALLQTDPLHHPSLHRAWRKEKQNKNLQKGKKELMLLQEKSK